MKNKILGGLFGVCIGDALGIPVEFKSREYFLKNPLSEMIGYGTYNQPPGTWSDDSSLTLCLAESLSKEYDLDDIADKFIKWLISGYLTPHGEAFDVGNSTREAIERLIGGVSPIESGLKDEYSNGNGSLMRILPLIFYTKDFYLDKRHKIVHDVSSITHKHLRSKLACSIYVEFGVELLKNKTKTEAYKDMKKIILDYFNDDKYQKELSKFSRILKDDIWKLDKDSIRSTGYVVDSLESAIWCFLNNDNYKSTVLEAVNLGSDTDTIASISGGLAGIYYGYDSIPNSWIDKIHRKDDIYNIAINLTKKLFS